MPNTAFVLSPSRIARFFFHECERNLRFLATPQDQREAAGVPEPAFAQSPATAAMLERGYLWEEHVVAKVLGARCVVARTTDDVPLRDRVHGPQATLQLLAQSPVGTFIYQPTLRMPPTFLESYGIDPGRVNLSDNRPDLVEVVAGEDGARVIRVIDLKASDALKITHRVQVVLYAIELEHLARAEGIDVTVDLGTGAVWLGGRDAPTQFDLRALRPHVEQFLRRDLPAILARPVGEAPWHLHFRCEWCEWFRHCRAEAEQTRSVSLMPYLSPHARRFFAAEGVDSLDDLAGRLGRDDADALLSTSPSLAGRRGRLLRQAEALRIGSLRRTNGSSLAMPKGENVRLTLTVQSEPVEGEIYLYGLKVDARADVLSDVLAVRHDPEVFLAHDRGRVAHARAAFLRRLHEVLRRLHEHNQGRPWGEQLSLQTYIYDSAEVTRLLDALLRSLDEEGELARTALALLFHFQDANLLKADRQPGVEVHTPVVVVTDVLRRLFALPVGVAWQLHDALAAVPPKQGRAFEYTRDGALHFALSNTLRADPILRAWDRDEPDWLDRLDRDAKHRLRATSSLVAAIRQQADDLLFAWPAKFSLPGDWNLRNADLARLAFLTRWESVIACAEVRAQRTDPREERLARGTALRAIALDGNRLRLDTPADLEGSSLPQWLVAADDAEGERQTMAFPDYTYRAFRAPSGERFGACAVVALQPTRLDPITGQTLEVQVTWKSSLRGGLQTGRAYLLSARYTDVNADKVVAFLEAIDAAPAAFFPRILADPSCLGEPQPVHPAARASLARWRGALDLTPSQRAAFDAVCSRRGTVVWGPPGTGKTTFLAHLVVAFVEAHQRAGRSVRVLLTAYTHAAIEHLLAKVASLRERFGVPDLTVAKLKSWLDAGRPLDGVALWPAPTAGQSLATTPAAVVGGTVYTTGPFLDDRPFDLVVIDEASQMRVAEAALPLSVGRSTARFVIAGDDRQLPPILRATYPEPPEGRTPLHRSLFEALRSGEVRRPGLVLQLHETFRMNDVLTGFVAGQLYGPAYQCADATIAARRLAWSAPDSVAPELGWCLDPTFPLVLVSLEGAAFARENPLEATLVARLVGALRDGLQVPEGSAWPEGEAGDARFFREGVFVVSPHHAQIHALRRSLRVVREWRHRPFVGTVDKMQGQEAACVLVSYGVASPEAATQEARFIYSMQRLNVAITRAKTKCIVCLPQGLLDGVPQVLEDEEAAKGIGLMRALRDHLVATGERLEIPAVGVAGARFVAWRTAAVPRP